MDDFKKDEPEKPGDAEFAKMLKSNPNLQAACDRLVSRATQTREMHVKEKLLDDAKHSITDEQRNKEIEIERRLKELELREGAIQYALENNVDPKLAIRFVGETSKETKKNLDDVLGMIATEAERKRREFIASHSYTPQAGTGSALPFDGDVKKYEAALKNGAIKFDKKIDDEFDKIRYSGKRR